MEEQKNIIEMTDAEGHTVKAELYDVFEYESQKYALLVPIAEGDEEDQQPMMAVMRLVEVEDGYAIEEIGSDEEWEKVQAFLNHPCQCGEGKEGCHCGNNGEESGCGCGKNQEGSCCGEGDGQCHCKE